MQTLQQDNSIRLWAHSSSRRSEKTHREAWKWKQTNRKRSAETSRQRRGEKQKEAKQEVLSQNSESFWVTWHQI